MPHSGVFKSHQNHVPGCTLHRVSNAKSLTLAGVAGVQRHPAPVELLGYGL